MILHNFVFVRMSDLSVCPILTLYMQIKCKYISTQQKHTKHHYTCKYISHHTQQQDHPTHGCGEDNVMIFWGEGTKNPMKQKHILSPSHANLMQEKKTYKQKRLLIIR